jgi:hypothetical protein
VARLMIFSGTSDDTTNIHPGQGPIAVMAHEAGCNPKIESRSAACLLRS